MCAQENHFFGCCCFLPRALNSANETSTYIFDHPFYDLILYRTSLAKMSDFVND